MADRRIYVGYYRRYDGKVIYVVTMAKDADTDEDAVIWTPNVYSDKRAYYTISKRSFLRLRFCGWCAPAEVQTADSDVNHSISDREF